MSAKFGVHEEDVQHVDGSTGVLMLGVRNDNQNVQSNTNGDYTSIQMTKNGAIHMEPNIFRTAFSESAVSCKYPQLQYSFPTHIDPEFWNVGLDSTVLSGTVTVSDGMAIVDSGSSSETGSLTMSSVARGIYHAGQGLLMQYSGIFTGDDKSNTISMIGYGTPATDGFLFGYNGSNFGIFHYKNGTRQSFTAQSSWNKDVMDGTGPSGITLDPSKTNIYFIQMQLHYMGNIMFYVEVPDSSIHRLVHKIQWVNTNTITNILSGNVPLTLYVEKTANTTNDVQVKSASLCLFTEGQDLNIGRRGCLPISVSSISSNSEVAYMSIRNPLTILNSVTNVSIIVIDSITASVESGNNESVIRVRRGSNITGTDFSGANWTTYNYSSSVVDYIDHTSSAPAIDPVVDNSLDRFQAVTATTVTLPVSYSGTDNFYNGRIICITGGTGEGQVRKITDYNGTTKVATVARWETQPDTGDSEFRIENGKIIDCMALGRCSGIIKNISGPQAYRLSPGEIITLTVQGSGTPDFTIAVGWIEIG